MNRQLESRMKKLEEKCPEAALAIIVYAKWDELNEDAIKASFVGPPPTDVPIYVFTEEMTTEQWQEQFAPRADPDYWKDRGGSWCMFVGMDKARKIRVADRPVKC